MLYKGDNATNLITVVMGLVAVVIGREARSLAAYLVNKLLGTAIRRSVLDGQDNILVVQIPGIEEEDMRAALVLLGGVVVAVIVYEALDALLAVFIVAGTTVYVLLRAFYGPGDCPYRRHP